MSDMFLLTWLYTEITQIAHSPMGLETGGCQAISLDDKERPVATVKVKREENRGLGACPQNTFSGPRPLERRKTPLWNMGERFSHH